MINYRQIEYTITTGLQSWLESKGYKCPVVMANQTMPAPPYPYIAYTVTTPVSTNMKGYNVAEDGTRYKELTQTWSFTALSGDEIEVLNVAMEALDWFVISGNTFLSDNGIVVQRVGIMTSRDNLLSIEYEYRKGFDVIFSLVHTISKADSEQAGYIESANVNKEV